MSKNNISLQFLRKKFHGTPEILFFPQGLRNALEIHISQVTCRRVRNKEFFLEVKITKREQRTIETLINNYMAKERAFYRLNEQFVSNITGDMIFSRRSSERFGNTHLASDLPTCAKQRIFP